MAQKTVPTSQSVDDFLGSIADEGVRDDCYALIKLMSKITGAAPVLWGGSIIGFGKYHYKYESGHEGFSCLTGFSPRKQNISLYVMPGYEMSDKQLSKLGKHKAGKGCFYVKRLQDVDVKILEQLIRSSVKMLKAKFPQNQ